MRFFRTFPALSGIIPVFASRLLTFTFRFFLLGRFKISASRIFSAKVSKPAHAPILAPETVRLRPNVFVSFAKKRFNIKFNNKTLVRLALGAVEIAVEFSPVSIGRPARSFLAEYALKAIAFSRAVPASALLFSA